MEEETLERQEELLKRYTESRGFPPTERLQKFAELDPDFFEKYLSFTDYPRKARVLSPKMIKLIAIAINSSVTLLYEPGLRAYIRHALNEGVTKEEILAVFQLVTLVGTHTCTTGMSILAEEYGKQLAKETKQGAASSSSKEVSERQAELLRKYSEKRAGMPPGERMQKFAELDPDFFEEYLNLSDLPIKPDILSDKERELIWIAMDSSATHLFEPGMRAHIRYALELGVSKEEILAVFQLVSFIGFHSCTVGIPILAEEYGGS